MFDMDKFKEEMAEDLEHLHNQVVAACHLKGISDEASLFMAELYLKEKILKIQEDEEDTKLSVRIYGYLCGELAISMVHVLDPEIADKIIEIKTAIDKIESKMKTIGIRNGAINDFKMVYRFHTDENYKTSIMTRYHSIIDMIGTIPKSQAKKIVSTINRLKQESMDDIDNMLNSLNI